MRMNATTSARTTDHTLSRRAQSSIVAILVATISVLTVDAAFAYRPFDGTDAAVAEPGEMEIELQPAGVLSSNGQRTLVAPATVLNFGLVKNWEAVFEGRLETPLEPSGPTRLNVAGACLKHVFAPRG